MAVNAWRVFGVGFLTIISIASLMTFILVITGVTYEPKIVTVGIQCGDMKTEYMSIGETIHFSFINLVEQTVTFTNCGSEYWEEMYLMDSAGNYIQSQSTNECDGYGCYDPDYCSSDTGSVSFTMENLAAGSYTIEVIKDVWGNDTSVVVQVLCNTSVSIQQIRQYDISCGETITGNVMYPEVAFFNFTNSRQQEVVFTNCDSGYTDMYLKNSTGGYIHSQSVNLSQDFEYLYCGWGDEGIFIMDALLPGVYTIELVPYYATKAVENVTFSVSVICPQWQIESMECGQNFTTFTTNNSNDFLLLNFTNPDTQHVILGIHIENFHYSLNYSQIDEYYYSSAILRNSAGKVIMEQYLIDFEIDTILSAASYTLMFSLGSSNGTEPLTVFAICSPIEAYDVECDKSINKTVSMVETLYFTFNNTKQQDVTFTNCHSTFSPDLWFLDSEGNDILGQARNQCNGWYCYDAVYECPIDTVAHRVTFTMDELPIGQYFLQLDVYPSWNESGIFDIKIMCNETLTAMQINSLGCDETISSTMRPGETILFEFVSTRAQNVLFTNCGENANNTQIKLRNSAGEYVHEMSTNECDGYVCSFADGYCSDAKAVTFFIEDLPEDIYTVELIDEMYAYSSEYYEYSFSIQTICDAIPCDSYEFSRNLTGVESHFVYECMSYVESIDAIRSQFCNGRSGLSIDEMNQIEQIYQMVEDLGIGIGNNILLLSLLFVNVSTAIFIIFGINQLPLDMDIRAMICLILMTQLLLITSFLSFNSEQFGACVLKVGQSTADTAPSLFHFVILVVATFLCTFGGHFLWCGRYRLNYLAFVFSLILPMVYWFTNPNDALGPDLAMMFLYLYIQSAIPLCLLRLTSRLRTSSEWKSCLFDFGLHIALFLSGFLLFVWLSLATDSQHSWSGLRLIYEDNFTWFPTFLWTDGYCSFIAQASWFNPLFILSNLYLLFSEFRVLAVIQNLTLFLIFMFKWFDDSGYFCSAIVNVQYILHSFFIPIYIFLFFHSLPALQRLKISLLGLYLVALDVFLDMVVVFFFIAETEYIFAVLQVLAIISGQVAGAVSDVSDEQHGDFTFTDKLMAATGFGRVWFTVNWWKETLTTEDNNGKYMALRKKHKIWDLLYEAFPTVALQIFAAMTTTVSSTALVVSIVTSVLSISFAITIYIKDLLSVTTSAPSSHTRIASTASTMSSSQETMSPELTTIESSQRNTVQKGSNPMYLALFAFMFSDFYIRSIPTVMALAVLSTKWFDEGDDADFVWKMVIGSLLFGTIAVFEFTANQKIRISSHSGFVFIFKIFAASIFSSFYTMLCTLNVLKTDPFYAESVVFSKYLVEHGIRCAVAMIFCIFSVPVIGGTLWYPWILSALFVVSLAINGRSMHWIYESEFMSNQQKESQSIELQTVEKEMAGNMRTTSPTTDTAEGNQSGLESVDLERSQIQFAEQGGNGIDTNDVVTDKTD